MITNLLYICAALCLILAIANEIGNLPDEIDEDVKDICRKAGKR
jgi:hypothetical protein